MSPDTDLSPARPAMVDPAAGDPRFADPRTVTLRVPPGQPLWVFAYGSLMWNPGFDFMERRPALLRGYHRRFCVYSHRYRGTPERPGLVLGLDRGGSCRGFAFKAGPEGMDRTLAYLWDREMVTGVYRPSLLRIELPDGQGGIERQPACCFVVDRKHRQYCGRLDIDRTAAMIGNGVGKNGPNPDYLFNTVEHLEEMGVHDRALVQLAERVRAVTTVG